MDPEPETSITCPFASVLSGVAVGTSGQVKLTPPALTDDPGARPAAARPSAEKVVPIPSKPAKPGEGFVSALLVIPRSS